MKFTVSPLPEPLDAAAFGSGAALALLDAALRDSSGALPAELLHQRLALRASALCLAIEGRGATEQAIRDAVCLTHPGDAPGPVGAMFVLWQRAVATDLRRTGWQARLAERMPGPVAGLLREGIADGLRGSPVAQAAQMLAQVLHAAPREQTLALICADAALASAMRWGQPLPLMALHLKRAGQGLGRDALLLACHRAVALAAGDAIRQAHSLTRCADTLRRIAPRLRAKGAQQAVALFLREDAVAPSAMLSPRIKGTATAMTDRAARRLCDRLVSLGAVRELTGRSNFRLYGVA